MCRQSYVPGGLSLIYVNYFTFSYNYLCITAKSILLDILTTFFCLYYRQTQCQHGKYFYQHYLSLIYLEVHNRFMMLSIC